MSAIPPDHSSPPPVPPEPLATSVVSARQQKKDADQIKLLGVFHYVLAGFSVLGAGALYLHSRLMNLMFDSPEMMAGPNNQRPPEEFFAMFQYMYLFMGFMIVVFGVANVISGWAIQTRQYRMLSLVIAGFNCVMFPFGTALGIFTLVVLLRDTVEEAYTTHVET